MIQVERTAGAAESVESVDRKRTGRRAVRAVRGRPGPSAEEWVALLLDAPATVGRTALLVEAAQGRLW